MSTDLINEFERELRDYAEGNGHWSKVEAARDALRAALSAAAKPVEQWRPIETAPKDGTRILVWPWKGQVDHDQWNEETDEQWLPGVTHWMPLPSAPGAEQAKPVEAMTRKDVDAVFMSVYQAKNGLPTSYDIAAGIERHLAAAWGVKLEGGV